MQTFTIAAIAVVLVGVAMYLIGSMLYAIRKERGVRKKWRNFGLSIAFCFLFLLTWVGQAFAEWGVYRADQEAHGETPTISGYAIEFGQSTLENWQSEFLQLFSFVVLSALLIHKGSAESKDGDERMEAALKRIEARLEEMGG